MMPQRRLFTALRSRSLLYLSGAFRFTPQLKGTRFPLGLVS